MATPTSFFGKLHGAPLVHSRTGDEVSTENQLGGLQQLGTSRDVAAQAASAVMPSSAGGKTQS